MVTKHKPPRFRDNIYIGAFLGLVFPVFGFLLYYLFFFYDQLTLTQYWDFLFEKKLVSSVLSLSILMNLPVFLHNLWSHRHESMKGVVGATIFYGVLIILFKFQ